MNIIDQNPRGVNSAVSTSTVPLKRAVLYAPVSSDDRGKDRRNLQGQLEMCREYAQERGWRVVAELAKDDRGASGASFELPKLGQVLEMAQTGYCDILVVRELDRLSRNLAKQLVVEEELKRHSVEVEYALEDCADTPEGRLNKHIRATIAEYEREKIAERKCSRTAKPARRRRSLPWKKSERAWLLILRLSY